MTHVPLWRFYAYFLRLGATGFGGPIALAGFMQRDLAEERKWISPEGYTDGLALAQPAPGPTPGLALSSAARSAALIDPEARTPGPFERAERSENGGVDGTRTCCSDFF